jgi:hypothetical protein
MANRRLLEALSLPRWVSMAVVAALLAIGAVLVFGPATLRGPLVVVFLAAMFTGGLVLIVVPRKSYASRIRSVGRQESEVPTLPRRGFLRRVAWWKLTWTFDTPVTVADSQKYVGDLMAYFKEAREWPFGDPSTALRTTADGFSTSPGWWWNVPYKVTVTGACKPSGPGSRYWFEVALAYDPAFEVLFSIASTVIAIGWLVALAESSNPARSFSFLALGFLPLGFVPLAIVVLTGMLGRKWVKQRATGLVQQLVTHLGGRGVDFQMGW